MLNGGSILRQSSLEVKLTSQVNCEASNRELEMSSSSSITSECGHSYLVPLHAGGDCGDTK